MNCHLISDHSLLHTVVDWTTIVWCHTSTDVTSVTGLTSTDVTCVTGVARVTSVTSTDVTNVTSTDEGQHMFQPDCLCIVIWILAEGEGRANVPQALSQQRSQHPSGGMARMFNPCNLPPWTSAAAAAKDLQQHRAKAQQPYQIHPMLVPYQHILLLAHTLSVCWAPVAL